MQVAFEIPDDLAALIAQPGKGLSRAALEALAVEGYRSEQLTEAELRRLLGFETRMEVHSFLKAHGAWLPSGVSELEGLNPIGAESTPNPQQSCPGSERRNA